VSPDQRSSLSSVSVGLYAAATSAVVVAVFIAQADMHTEEWWRSFGQACLVFIVAALALPDPPVLDRGRVISAPMVAAVPAILLPVVEPSAVATAGTLAAVVSAVRLHMNGYGMPFTARRSAAEARLAAVSLAIVVSSLLYAALYRALSFTSSNNHIELVFAAVSTIVGCIAGWLLLVAEQHSRVAPMADTPNNSVIRGVVLALLIFLIPPLVVEHFVITSSSAVVISAGVATAAVTAAVVSWAVNRALDATALAAATRLQSTWNDLALSWEANPTRYSTHEHELIAATVHELRRGVGATEVQVMVTPPMSHMWGKLFHSKVLSNGKEISEPTSLTITADREFHAFTQQPLVVRVPLFTPDGETEFAAVAFAAGSTDRRFQPEDSRIADMITTLRSGLWFLRRDFINPALDTIGSGALLTETQVVDRGSLWIASGADVDVLHLRPGPAYLTAYADSALNHDNRMPLAALAAETIRVVADDAHTVAVGFDQDKTGVLVVFADANSSSLFMFRDSIALLLAERISTEQHPPTNDTVTLLAGTAAETPNTRHDYITVGNAHADPFEPITMAALVDTAITASNPTAAAAHDHERILLKALLSDIATNSATFSVEGVESHTLPSDTHAQDTFYRLRLQWTAPDYSKKLAHQMAALATNYGTPDTIDTVTQYISARLWQEVHAIRQRSDIPLTIHVSNTWLDSPTGTALLHNTTSPQSAPPDNVTLLLTSSPLSSAHLRHLRTLTSLGFTIGFTVHPSTDMPMDALADGLISVLVIPPAVTTSVTTIEGHARIRTIVHTAATYGITTHAEGANSDTIITALLDLGVDTAESEPLYGSVRADTLT